MKTRRMRRMKLKWMGKSRTSLNQRRERSKVAMDENPISRSMQSPFLSDSCRWLWFENEKLR